MLYNAKEGTIKFQDCEMDYLVFGEGTQPLVLIQGLNLSYLKGGKWTQPGRYKLYGKHFRVYIIDRRKPLFEGITVKDIADDIAAALKVLGIKRAPVMGNSQGGMIAQYLALNYPKLVSKLVLNVTTSGEDKVLRDNVEHWMEMADEGKLNEISLEMSDKLYPPGLRPKYSKLDLYLYSKQKTREAQDFKALAEACLTVDTYDRLKEIKCPVMVLGGREDEVISCQAYIKLAEGLGVEPMIFEGLGHMAYETKEYQERVLSFLME